jgi:hypothetical protein
MPLITTVLYLIVLLHASTSYTTIFNTVKKMQGKTVMLPLQLTDADVSYIQNLYFCWDARNDGSHNQFAAVCTLLLYL